MGRLGLVNRRLLARYLAPAAFLLAVTGVVLVVRTGLRSHTPATTTATTATTSSLVVTVGAPVKPPAAPKRYYVIASGDTLDGIATRFATTVDELLRLNPGVQPSALTPGAHVRVK